MYCRYAIKRILQGILTYVIIILIFSALFNTVMEKTLRVQINEMIQGELMSKSLNMSNEDILRYRETRIKALYDTYHLNDPILYRIFWRAVDTLTFNFGKASVMKSSGGDTDVWEILKEAIPRTLILFTTAALINVFLGILLGIKKAQKPGRTLDQSTSIVTMVVYGVPSWWVAMIFIMIFVYIIPLFPSGGFHSTPPPQGLAYYLDLLYHMALPVLTLVIIGFWGTAYVSRNIVLGTLQEDYIMSARARGLPERKVLYGHALRTAAPPIVTMAVLNIIFSISGRIIFEGVFSWPGMGHLYWVAVQQNDLPVLMGNLAVTTGMYLTALVFLDLIYGYLDPRIKVGGKQ